MRFNTAHYPFWVGHPVHFRRPDTVTLTRSAGQHALLISLGLQTPDSVNALATTAAALAAVVVDAAGGVGVVSAVGACHVGLP